MSDSSCFVFVISLAGPVAIFLCIKILKRIARIEQQLGIHPSRPSPSPKPSDPLPSPHTQQVPHPPKPVEKTSPQPFAVTIPKITQPPKKIEPLTPLHPPIAKPPTRTGSIEQQIGTKWVLIAGIITVFVAVGFFLKYAYDNFSLSPSARVLAVTIIGLIALATGEITRRRGYEIVAKGTTALGFAILYIAVFSAHRFYQIIPSTPAFAIAVLITTAALLYAVILDELLIAFISLFGGFFSPIMVSTGQNMPNQLFSYCLILSLGAMLCALYRKWRAVNWLAFIGTWLLYIGWFEKFYYDTTPPQQMQIAISWLVAFFLIYMAMPIAYNLIKKTKTRAQDVILVLVNAFVILYWLWTILNSDHQTPLAFAMLGLSAVHFTVMLIAVKRCKEDTNLHTVLLAISLLFLTVAMPIYFSFTALTIAWAAESTILVIIALRYKSILTHIAAAIALLLSLASLMNDQPMHTEPFTIILNPQFGSWCFVAACAIISHILYRRSTHISEMNSFLINQATYAITAVILFIAMALEWYLHCKHNLANTSEYCILKGNVVILAIMLLCFIRPLCPKGSISNALSIIITAAGTIITLIFLESLHSAAFTVFANADFAVPIIFVAALGAYHLRYRFSTSPDRNDTPTQASYIIAGLLLFISIAAEWYWHCQNNIADHISADVKGYIVILALAVLFFTLRPICPRRLPCKLLATVIATAGSVYTVRAFAGIYNDSFVIVLNHQFAIALAFVAALIVAFAMFLRFKHEDDINKNLAAAFGLGAAILLLILLTEEIYLYFDYLNRSGQTTDNWEFLAHTWISITWAVYACILMAAGFIRNIKPMRYLSLFIFAILLLKVFIVDTAEVKSVYRIPALAVTGFSLVAVSYLYQFLKKKGFFEALLPTETKTNNNKDDPTIQN